MTYYDNWKTNNDDYYCEPEIVETQYEYYGDEYETVNIMNCHNCENESCEYWGYYNDND